jgi:hypothetical protein
MSHVDFIVSNENEKRATSCGRESNSSPALPVPQMYTNGGGIAVRGGAPVILSSGEAVPSVLEPLKFLSYRWERALERNWAGHGTDVEMNWHCYPATVHFPSYGIGVTMSDMEDSYCDWWSDVRSDVHVRRIVADKATYWNQEGEPYWGIQNNIVSIEERRCHDQYSGMQWTQRPHMFSGTLMALRDKHNHSFEEDRYQYWLRDTNRRSTLVAPARDAHVALQLTHTRMKDRESHAVARARETPEQRELRLKKDRERHAERRAQLRAQERVLVDKKTIKQKPHLDQDEIERRRKLNRDVQQRWRDKLTDEKKQQLLQIRREEYYPTERRQKRSRRHH